MRNLAKPDIEKSEAEIFLLINDKGEILYSNIRKTGYLKGKPGNPIVNSIYDLVHPDEHLELRKHIEKCAESQSEVAITKQRLACTQGAWQNYHGTVTNISNQNRNKLYALNYTIWSESDSINSMESLHEDAESPLKLLNGVFETLPVNIALLDKEGNIIKVNAQWIRFGKENGLSENYTCIGKNYLEVCEQSMGREFGASDFMISSLKEILAGKLDYFSTEYPCHSQDVNRWFKVEIKPLIGIQFKGFVVMHANITERKCAELQLLQTKINQEALINSTKDLIWSVDSGLRIIAANKSYYDAMKWATSRPISEGDSVIVEEFGTELARKWKTYYQKALEGRSFEIREEVLNPHTNQVNYAHITLNPIRSNDGTIVGAACFSRDITEETIAGIKLAKTKQELDKIMNSSPDVICSIDPKGNFIKVNAASVSIWGYKPEEMAGKPYLKFIYIADRKKSKDRLNEIIAGSELKNFENRFVKKDLSVVELSWSARWDETEQRVFAIARDATERKRAEREVSLLINNTEEAFLLTDKKLKIVSFNNRFNELYSMFFKTKVRKGDSIIQYAPSYRIKTVKKIYNQVLRGKVRTSEIQVVDDSQNARHFLIKYNPARNEEGKIIGVFVTGAEITEMKKAEQQKEFERRDKEAMINSTDDLIWSVSNDYKLIAANDSFIKTIKDTTGVLLKMGDDLLSNNIYSADYLEFWNRLYDTALLGNSFKKEIFSPSVIKEHSTWYDTSFNPVYNGDKVVGIVCYSRNITERKLAEIERNQITHDLMQRNRDLEQYAFIVSHNLRAPTANIIGFSEALKEDILDEEQRKEMTQGLSISVNKLDNVIKDLNKILQIKRSSEENKEEVCFSKLVDDIIVSMANVISKCNAKITYDFSQVDSMYTLMPYMNSIFFNLISNSIKYRKSTEFPQIQITSYNQKEKVILNFQDNGIGIDLSKNGDKVFGLYKRFHFHVEGKGMGLFMVKKQVEALGGNISVFSKPNEGTLFTLEF